MRHLLTAVGLCVLASACTGEPDPLTEERWELVWSDEFKGDALDDTVWTAEIGTGQGGWGNNELQYYTDRSENVRLNGEGFLIIEGRREDYEGQAWTSARLKTQDKLDFTYGRIEARIKLPIGKGLWPAFWMLGSDIEQVSWPSCGEIDIMENFARSTTQISGTIHGPGYSGGSAYGGEYTFPEGQDISGFHSYRIDWDPEHISWYVDDELYHRAHPGNVSDRPWVLDHRFFLLLNLAIGGNPVEDPDSSTPDSNQMVVDWVRVYERREPIVDPGIIAP